MDAPDRSLVASRLIDAGARRLADTFCFPVSRGARTFAYTSTVREVAWRTNTTPFYIRSSAVPFDLHPLRPTDPRREGVFFSIGPGVIAGNSERLVDMLVLVQFEGTTATADAALASVEESLSSVARLLERVEFLDASRGWRTLLLSAVASR